MEVLAQKYLRHLVWCACGGSPEAHLCGGLLSTAHYAWDLSILTQSLKSPHPLCQSLCSWRWVWGHWAALVMSGEDVVPLPLDCHHCLRSHVMTPSLSGNWTAYCGCAGYCSSHWWAANTSSSRCLRAKYFESTIPEGTVCKYCKSKRGYSAFLELNVLQPKQSSIESAH